MRIAPPPASAAPVMAFRMAAVNRSPHRLWPRSPSRHNTAEPASADIVAKDMITKVHMLFRSIISSFQCCQLKLYIKLGACLEGGLFLNKKMPATCYSPTAFRCSTIAAEELNFRVRDGNGCGLFANVTGKFKIKENRQARKALQGQCNFVSSNSLDSFYLVRLLIGDPGKKRWSSLTAD